MDHYCSSDCCDTSGQHCACGDCPACPAGWDSEAGQVALRALTRPLADPERWWAEAHDAEAAARIEALAWKRRQ